MATQDIAVAATITHAVLLTLGFLCFRPISKAFRTTESSTTATWLLFALHVTPTLLIFSVVGCWLCTLLDARNGALVLLIVPAAVPVFLLLMFLFGNVDDGSSGMSNKDLMRGSNREYFENGISHAHIAEEMVAQGSPQGHVFQYSPYLETRLGQAN